jgi:putative adhesin
MSNQEMQFADPDWKPSQQLGMKTDTQEQAPYNPQPINADLREQPQEKIAPPQQDVYAGLPPYAGTAPRQSVGGQYGQRQYRRRARSPWFWIILAFIIISLMGGGFGSTFNRSFGPPDFGRMGQYHPRESIVEPHNFTVTGTPTVVINGDIHFMKVHTSANGNSVSVQDTKSARFFGNSGDPNDIQVTSSQNGNTITTNVQDNGQGSVDFDVTVPQGADLQLTTNSGDISIDGVTLSGNSIITTDSGDISFNGTIATSGTAQFTTSSGTIDLTVPGTSAFYVNASTISGSIHTKDFPSVKVQTNNQGRQATGNVGTVSQGQGATVTLHTVSGDINLHQGS